MTQRYLVRVVWARNTRALGRLGVRRHELARATSRLRLARQLAVACSVLVLVGPARAARTRLRRAVGRDLLPSAAVRLRHTRTVRQVEAVVTRRARGAAVRWARYTRRHVAVRARRTLLELTLAIVLLRGRLGLILRAGALLVRCTRAARVVRQRRWHLHVLAISADVDSRALAIHRCRRCARLARAAERACRPCHAGRRAVALRYLVRAGRARAASALGSLGVGRHQLARAARRLLSTARGAVTL